MIPSGKVTYGKSPCFKQVNQLQYKWSCSSSQSVKLPGRIYPINIPLNQYKIPLNHYKIPKKKTTVFPQVWPCQQSQLPAASRGLHNRLVEKPQGALPLAALFTGTDGRVKADGLRPENHMSFGTIIYIYKNIVCTNHVVFYNIYIHI